MTSLARLHRERSRGALAATQMASAGERTGPAATEYQLQCVRLGVDLRRLKDIQSIERKIDLKRELLPEYDAWVAGVLDADAGGQDDIFTHAMIWRIDTGDFAGAMPLARYVLRHKLTLPERFDRTAPTMICEEIADAALKAFGQDRDFDLALLEEVGDLIDNEDVFDQVRAKIEKAIGIATIRAADAIAADADGPAGAKRTTQTRAVAHLRRALELDANAGVKKRIEQLDRELKRESAGSDAEAPAGADAGSGA